VTIPVNVCGNAVAILGFADAGCQGGAGALLLDSFNG
jgi:ChpA-C